MLCAPSYLQWRTRVKLRRERTAGGVAAAAGGVGADADGVVNEQFPLQEGPDAAGQLNELGLVFGSKTPMTSNQAAVII
jgi:hypothetical protein